MRKNREQTPTYRVLKPPIDSLGATIGYLKPVTYDELVARFGEPFFFPLPEEEDGRLQVLWTIMWDDGSLNEIYDYKIGPQWLGPVEGVPYQQVESWNVAGDEEGYRRLVKLFGVRVRREPNPSKERPRVDLDRPAIRRLKRNLMNG